MRTLRLVKKLDIAGNDRAIPTLKSWKVVAPRSPRRIPMILSGRFSVPRRREVGTRWIRG